MKVEQDVRMARWRIGWRGAGAGVLGLAVLSAVVFGPWGVLSFLAGWLQSSLLLVVFAAAAAVAWVALLIVACIWLVRHWRARRKQPAAYWSIVAVGVVLAFALQIMGTSPIPMHYFSRGVWRRVEIRTDMNAVQRWVESLSPSDCRDDRYPGRTSTRRHLRKEEQPQVLSRQNGTVHLELDAAGRPRVRLSWYEGKGGTWGLVIGSRDAKTPPSDPNAYGEWHRELRPGIYFWYVEG
jgi:hypothetical protein